RRARLLRGRPPRRTGHRDPLGEPHARVVRRRDRAAPRPAGGPAAGAHLRRLEPRPLRLRRDPRAGAQPQQHGRARQRARAPTPRPRLHRQPQERRLGGRGRRALRRGEVAPLGTRGRRALGGAPPRGAAAARGGGAGRHGSARALGLRHQPGVPRGEELPLRADDRRGAPRGSVPQAGARRGRRARARERDGGAGTQGAALGRDVPRGVGGDQPPARQLRPRPLWRARRARRHARGPPARDAQHAGRRAVGRLRRGPSPLSPRPPAPARRGARRVPRALRRRRSRRPPCPQPARPARRPPGRVIAVGVIGTGKHGRRYLDHLRADVPELRRAAIARRDPTGGAAKTRERGCALHADWRALVDDTAMEAVVAVVPPALHPAIAAAVAAARKPLLIEKPLATSGEAAVGIVRTLRAAGVPCLMAHTLRWNGVVETLRAALPSLGPLRAVYLNQRFEPSPLRWLDEPELSGGGIMLHTGVHSFDLVRFLTGREVARVWCRTARAVTRRTEDNFAALLELAGSDTLVAVNGSRATAGRSGLIDL